MVRKYCRCTERSENISGGGECRIPYNPDNSVYVVVVHLEEGQLFPIYQQNRDFTNWSIIKDFHYSRGHHFLELLRQSTLLTIFSYENECAVYSML